MFKRIVPLLVLAALVIPAATAAKDVSGPATLAGHGPVRGMMRSADGPARVELRLSGKILVSGRARDLEVSCTGASVKMRSAVNWRGLELVVCKGRRMTVVVSATAFHFGALASRWLIQIPEGVSGMINGRFRMQDDLLDKRHERPADPAEPEVPAGR